MSAGLMVIASLAAATPGADDAALAAACKGRSGWNDAAPAARIFGNVYFVGTCGITVLLITSPRGHVLIDGAIAEAVPSILANITALGFRPRDVRLLLSGHEHIDHAGGLALLKHATGARMLARAPARAVLESGGVDQADPQAGALPGFDGVKVDGVVRDGQIVRAGTLKLKAIATPGHTQGATSWTWRSCEAKVCRTIVYADSISAVSSESYRFTDHSALVTTFRATFDTVARLDCGLLLTPHPSASRLFERLAGLEPLADGKGCASYAEAGRRQLDARLAKERGSP